MVHKKTRLRSWRRGIIEKSWCHTYAKTSLRLKCVQDQSDEIHHQCTHAIETAFGTIYRSVAFDIDGTLTKTGGTEIDKPMALIVADLLRRGVPILLITGRGRNSARRAAESIRTLSDLSAWYYRRLRCISHNGLFLLSTPSDNPELFLVEERVLARPVPRINKLHASIVSSLEQLGFAQNTTATLEPCTGDCAPYSIRVSVSNRESIIGKVEDCIIGVVRKFQGQKEAMHILKGSYGSVTSFDITTTMKSIALTCFAEEIGVKPNQILRIGDQGQEGGNDHDLLDDTSGFSVRHLSSSPVRCHPVLSANLKLQLTGSEATQKIVDTIMLFPPLSISANPVRMRLSALRSFEKIALRRARDEMETVVQRLRVRLRYLLPNLDEIASLHNLHPSDIYDPGSGGVRFRDWELDYLPKKHPASELFDLSAKRTNFCSEPRFRWSMYTDTGIIMRGPDYYYSLTRNKKDVDLIRYIEMSCTFLKDSEAVLQEFLSEEPSLVRFKMILAICDNIRNILLQLQHAAFLIEGNPQTPTYPITYELFRDALVPHTYMHYNLLLDPDSDWNVSVNEYLNLIKSLPELLTRFGKKYKYEWNKVPEKDRLLRKWRECDHFLENITAVQLGLHELRLQGVAAAGEPAIAMGLVYGGTEFPAIAQAVAKARKYSLDIGLCAVSIYGNRRIGQMIRSGKQKYVEEMLTRKRPLVVISSEGCTSEINDRKVILLDDNCLTCVTLQLARDVMVLMGADVIGSIVARFPGVNRHIQMLLPNHGFPDTEILFSFIRGLISPSPYSRLLCPGEGKNRYLDSTGVFNKARTRIERYLLKNGTPAVGKKPA